MKYGNWLPISKGVLKLLPKDRPYTKIEALISIQNDYDRRKRVTINGYKNLWQWGKGKVYRFLKEIGVEIIYHRDTSKTQNQSGLINGLITDRSKEKNGLIRLIENKDLHGEADRYEKKSGLITDRSADRTINLEEPNTNSSGKKYQKKPSCDDCPCNQILDLYHRLLAELPRVRKFTERRRGMLSARWNEKAKSERGLYSNTLEFWEALFKYISRSDWLMGRKSDWQANFEWIVTKRNFNKIIEGVYHRG
jgi:hypothetical protein